MNHSIKPVYLKIIVSVLLLLTISGMSFWRVRFSHAFSPATAPYADSPIVASIVLDWDTHQRHAPGSDNWPTTWAADNHLYTAWGDGGGFGGTNLHGRVSLGMARIEGDWPQVKGINLWGGYKAKRKATAKGKSYGILAIGNKLYLWVSPDDGKTLYFGNRLYFSEDQGHSWKPAPWKFEKAEGLITPTFLQFGRGYIGARDAYVYIYAIHLTSENPKKLTVQKPGLITLMRVHREKVLKRTAYEFFAGYDNYGEPLWTHDFKMRKPVFEDPNGVGWNMSVSYNPYLKRYLLITEHEATMESRLGVFDAPEPWGPWTTVFYKTGLGKGHIQQTVFQGNFPTKWIVAKKNEFILVFTGTKRNDSWNAVRGRFVLRKN
jgi:hypothetical protein